MLLLVLVVSWVFPKEISEFPNHIFMSVHFWFSLSPMWYVKPFSRQIHGAGLKNCSWLSGRAAARCVWWAPGYSTSCGIQLSFYSDKHISEFVLCWAHFTPLPFVQVCIFFFSVSSSSSRPYISNSQVFIDGELCKRLQSDGPLAFWGRCNSITILTLLSCCNQPCRLWVLTHTGVCTVPSQKFFFPTSHSKNIK